jgi:hypothetical protein
MIIGYKDTFSSIIRFNSKMVINMGNANPILFDQHSEYFS